MDNITILMAAALVLVAFKDKLTVWTQKMKVKLTVTKARSLAEHHHARTMGAIERQGSEMMMFRGELNHIKGQLQELLHRQADDTAMRSNGYKEMKTLISDVFESVERRPDYGAVQNQIQAAKAAILEQLAKPTYVDSVDIKNCANHVLQLMQDVGEVKAALAKATGEEATAMNTLYMQGLGGLTRSQSTVVEKLTQMHESQVAVLAALNRLTTG